MYCWLLLITKKCIADYFWLQTSLHDFAYFVLHPSFKRSFLVDKNSNLFYFLRSYFTKPCKSVLLFRNNATRFHYKIQRRKFTMFSHTWGITSTVKLHRKSILNFYWGEGVGLWKTSHWHFAFQNRFANGP